MQKVVFLDRDGVVNRELGDYVYSLDRFEINDGVFDALKYWAKQGYSFAIVTNQGGISKKRYNVSDVQVINDFLIDWFKKHEFNLLDIAFCPHHDLIESCICRKPNSLMLEKLVAKYAIQVEDSFLIGDSLRDVQAAKRIGLKAIQIEPNSNLMHLI